MHQEVWHTASIFNGGNLRNAIPREAFAIITVPENNYTDEVIV